MKGLGEFGYKTINAPINYFWYDQHYLLSSKNGIALIKANFCNAPWFENTCTHPCVKKHSICVGKDAPAGDYLQMLVL